ncbi:MAG: AI-2E family transporter [uncultured Sulfurovum sp.]|uniref:AI-2E family transporter n=1 Tax=uncultured Sulfurovum sp. TaxID=269237 RepID=A0A6S6TQU5_9BACT|nr:MAG: AI-2E family transporter [uncultured Sulfurovum sp.]
MHQKISNSFQQGFILLLLLTVLVSYIGMIQEFLIALVLAAIFSGLLYPFYLKVLSKVKKKPVLAAASTLLITLFALGLPLATITGIVTSEAIEVSKKARPIVKKALDSKLSLSKKMPEWLPFKEKLEPFHDTIVDKISELTSTMGKWLVSSFSSATKGTLGFFMSLFIMLYAMFYFLIHGIKLIDSLTSLLPLSKEDRTEVMNRGLTVTKASLKGILIVGIIQGILIALAFWAIGIKGAAFWGSVVFLLSAIPGLGAPLIWVPATVYLLFTGDTASAIGLSIWGLLVVGLIDNFLRPWIVGSDAKLPDIVILISILGGIITFGAVGIILGPVIAALLDTILNIYKKTFQDQLPS